MWSPLVREAGKHHGERAYRATGTEPTTTIRWRAPAMAVKPAAARNVIRDLGTHRPVAQLMMPSSRTLYHSAAVLDLAP